MSQFENFKIRRIVMHQVFSLNEERERRNPILNDSLATVSEKIKEELERRIVAAMGKRSNCVELEIENVDVEGMFQVCGSMIREEDDKFILKSHKIAKKLNDVQGSRSIPGGVLLIFEGTTSSRNERYIGIIKAELHSGFTLKTENEHQVFDLITDLFLTPSQKLYKIGMFIEKLSTSHRGIDEVKAKHEYRAYVFDQNMAKSDTEKAAFYFFSSFMGCQAKIDSKILTKKLYISTKEFIDSNIDDEETKLNLYVALRNYFGVERISVISAHDFSERYLEDNKKDDFINFIESNDIPTDAISKDTSLIENNLKQSRIKFTSEVKISCPADKFHENVIFERFEDSYSFYKIKGKILGQE